ncbi:MAG TPA: 8-oxoguanine deaminase [Streptosporangiaceae bacterium]|nr:8-oxoguanine deaminase [Streptosporangiaceae bacterium]
MSGPVGGTVSGPVSARRATVVIENCAIATVTGAEYASGHIVLAGDRITAVGPGAAPAVDGAERVDAAGCLATPGLVNTHHHLYQWATQGMAQQATLFEWLTGLYPVWARLDAEIVRDAAGAALAWLALSGCTTTTDHHYVFPRGRGDLLEAEIAAARQVGLRFHPCRGSMDRGESRGGLPPDDIVEETEAALVATEEAIARHHDPSPGSMLRIAVAPCSPFSVTETLLTEAAGLARRTGVRLNTHLAETVEEDEHCREQFGRTPVEYMDSLGWLGPDVWFSHCVHLRDADVKRFALTGTAVAHCPSSNARLGAGVARIGDLLTAGAAVGIGVDGAASAELAPLVGELRQALLFQRALHGPGALTARQALTLGTLGGARCLGRADEIGTLEPGKLADIALWRLDGFHAAIADPVAALVFGAPPPLARLYVHGRAVVENGELRTADQDSLARAGAAARRRIQDGER